MTDYKILVQQILSDGKSVTVSASEIRDAATVDEAAERFIEAFRNRPDHGAPIAEAAQP